MIFFKISQSILEKCFFYGGYIIGKLGKQPVFSRLGVLCLLFLPSNLPVVRAGLSGVHSPKKARSQNVYSLKNVPKLGLRRGLKLPQKNDLNKSPKSNRYYQNVRNITFLGNFQELCLLAAVCWQI